MFSPRAVRRGSWKVMSQTKSEPSHEEIAVLAYEIWEDKLAHYFEQSDVENWLEAENVLRTKNQAIAHQEVDLRLSPPPEGGHLEIPESGT
jgi:Protein of unknown function (DUF2934)